MSLINQINGGLIQRLSASAGTSSAPSVSSINGKGVSASFDGANVNIREGLRVGGETFTRSLLRMSDAISSFQIVKSRLTEINSLVTDLSDLASQSARADISDDERSRLTSDFRSGLSKLNTLYASSDNGEIDLLDRNDLADVLDGSGIDTDAATKLAGYLRSGGGSDARLGFERALVSDGTKASPLTQKIDTRESALDAETVFKALAVAVKDDLKSINGVLEELNAAADFAGAGGLAFGKLYESILRSQDADKVAVELVSLIRNRVSDNELGPHSDLDTMLAAELLGS